MKLRLTRLAAAELDDILTYIASRFPGGARRVQRRLLATFAAIVSNPGLGRRTTNGRLRRIGATPYPYLVFYEPTADEVIIIGIRHGARDPSSMPDS